MAGLVGGQEWPRGPGSESSWAGGPTPGLGRPTEESCPRAAPRPAPLTAQRGRNRLSFNTKGILSCRKCITRKGGRGREERDASLPRGTPALPEPWAAMTKPSEPLYASRAGRIQTRRPPPRSRSEGLPPRPAPGRQRRELSLAAARTPVRLPPPFLPGARAPGLTLVVLHLAPHPHATSLPFRGALWNCRSGCPSLPAGLRPGSGLGCPAHSVGGEGVPSERGRTRQRPLSLSKTLAVPGTRPGFPPGSASVGERLAVGQVKSGPARLVCAEACLQGDAPVFTYVIFCKSVETAKFPRNVLFTSYRKVGSHPLSILEKPLLFQCRMA